ncbi:MAG: RCC1 domain-containing protein, partial [Oscillospiraceae bacterium]|nr:RCC1 domain-containing protein [Oscillospiraceae bacterium]
NGYGQCNVSDWTDIIAISAGEYHTVGLKKDGTVVAVGDNSEGQCLISAWTDITAVFVGGHITVCLNKSGEFLLAGNLLQAWPYESGDWIDIVTISSSLRHIVGLKKDGTVVAVGYNSNGQCNVSEWNLGEGSLPH